MSVRFLLAGCVLATACSNVKYTLGGPLELNRCETFMPGVTTRAEVLAALGPPTSLSEHGEGCAMVWEHAELHESQLGIKLSELLGLTSLLLGFGAPVPQTELFKVSIGDSTANRQVILLVFEGGLLAGDGMNHWREAFGKGGAAQFIASVQSVVDTDSFLDASPAFTWGRELLAALPETLNRAYSPDVELRAAPDRVGQNTMATRP